MHRNFPPFLKLLHGHGACTRREMNPFFSHFNVCSVVFSSLMDPMFTTGFSRITLERYVGLYSKMHGSFLNNLHTHKSHNLSTRCVHNRRVATLSTNCNNAVILSSCYKVVTQNLLINCWIAQDDNKLATILLNSTTL